MLLSGYSENRLLASLPPDAFESLHLHLQSVVLRSQLILFDGGDTISRVYFPLTSAISIGVVLANGQMIETAMIGRDGMLGGYAIENHPASCRAVVQIEGAAAAMDLNVLHQLADANEPISAMVSRQGQALLAQTQRIAACNASHPLEARLCRWFLRAHEACGKRILSTTQEAIAEILGVRRTSISLVAHTMQEAGLIKTRRGHIELLNLDELRKNACGCHESAPHQRDHFVAFQGADRQNVA